MKKKPPAYASVAATADRWGISKQMVLRYVADARIPGAYRTVSALGRVEIGIPETAAIPTARRSGPKPTKTQLETAQP